MLAKVFVVCLHSDHIHTFDLIQNLTSAVQSLTIDYLYASGTLGVIATCLVTRKTRAFQLVLNNGAGDCFCSRMGLLTRSAGAIDSPQISDPLGSARYFAERSS